MGEKKIVIYAKTNIEAGDEVTYGTSFPPLRRSADGEGRLPFPA